jgi:hypothetical protein
MLEPDRAERSLRSWDWRWMKLLLRVMRRLLLLMILCHDGYRKKKKKLFIQMAKRNRTIVYSIDGCARIGTRHFFSKRGKSA